MPESAATASSAHRLPAQSRAAWLGGEIARLRTQEGFHLGVTPCARVSLAGSV